ncbi:FtsX-like permease family protein [Vreelandella titanicae]|uniref:ABC transporter permease n=1 Tax=Vreelandella titanicae TaxID=664683 RepID=UPI00241C487A|nr:FtsX-like permease family protein [Halomonas titanicae]UEQ05315.1 FtsX-like permease family protein [Halomonas profundus]
MLRLAWRNVWRQRRRTLLTVSAITFATLVLVFMLAIQYSTYAIAIENTLSVFSGSFQVQRIGYQDDRRMDDTIADPNSLLAAISERLDTNAVAARAYGLGLISSKQRSQGVEVVGVMPTEEGRVSTVPHLIVEGRYLEKPEAMEAVLGKPLASNLQVEVGEELIFLGQGRHGSLAVAAIEVVGIFDSGAEELDQGTVHMPLPAFQSTFDLRDDVHAIVVGNIPLAQLEAASAATQALLPNGGVLEVVEWQRLIPGLEQAIALDQAGAWIMYLVLVIIVVLSILTTFLMSVMERIREFGVMLALGVSTRRIASLIMLETTLLVGLGVSIGLLLGSAAVEYLRLNGLAIPGASELASQFHLPSVIHPRLTPLSVIAGPLIVSVLTLLAALYPAGRITRLKPVDAMSAV